MGKRERMIQALEKLGIKNEAQLNEAIKKMKPLDISIMTVKPKKWLENEDKKNEEQTAS